MLKLAGQSKNQVCPRCLGKGSVPCPSTFTSRSTGATGLPYPQPSDGHPIPCPRCNGKKVICELD